MDGVVLVLNQNYEPLNVCNLPRAFRLVFGEKAEVIEYDHQVIRTPRTEYRAPSVIRLQYLIRRPRPRGRQVQVQLRQFRVQASKMRRLTRGPRRRSRIRNRFNRSNRSTRTSVRSRSRNRFRRLPSTRIIGFKEVIAGRVSIT